MALQRRRFLSYLPRASKYSARGRLPLGVIAVEERSIALSDDSLGGGVGGFSIGVKPLASERWGSRRMCASAKPFTAGL